MHDPKNPDPSKVAILRNRTPAIQVQTPPVEGPRILRGRQEIRWQPSQALLAAEIGPDAVQVK